MGADDGHEETEGVGGNVVAVVDGEDPCGGVATEREAVDEEAEFCADYGGLYD